MLLEIPTRNDLDEYDFEIDLSGSTFNLLINWNERCGCWSMTIRDGSKNVLLGSVPLLCGSDLVGRFSNPLLPQGTFIVVDTTGENQDPTYEGMGERWRLLFEDQT